MSSIDARRAHEARENRRRHLQQRQTVIFGSLIAGLLVIGLAAGAIWAGILPAPVSIPIQSPEPEDVAPAPPCPPEDALPVPLSEISADVLNGTNRAGLAASTSASLAERGVVIGDEANAPVGFEGVARIVSGPSAVAEAYTVAAQFPEALIELDGRAEDILTITVGEGFDGLLPEDSVELQEEVPLDPLPGCEPVEVVEETDGEEGEGDEGDGDEGDGDEDGEGDDD